MRSTWFCAALSGLLVASCGKASESGNPSLAGPADAAPGAPAATSDTRSVPAKLDLLLMIDNSVQMQGKRELLSASLRPWLAALVNPPCLDAAGNRQATPASGAEPCPEGQRREHPPLDDINLGLITSSLGDGGSNSACPQPGFPNYRADAVDMAHLLGSLPRGQGLGANASGVLTWRGADFEGFAGGLDRLIEAVGDRGCGNEMQLEAWYRFLIDPQPYAALERAACPGRPEAEDCIRKALDATGQISVDQALLEQRAAFLRPDSWVAILSFTDENDCSLSIGPQNWVALDIAEERPMFRAASVCEQNPNDRCCYSCPLGPPSGCSADPICAADPESGALQNRLPPEADGRNLRCFEQKRRFGIDLLYPTARYVNALREPELCLERDDLSPAGCGRPLPNPLYVGGRTPDRVFLASIVGVPWQAIASSSRSDGAALDPETELRFKDADELERDAVWPQILGSRGLAWRALSGSDDAAPGTGSPPLLPSDPYLIESTAPRAGISAGNPINGREHETSQSFGGITTADDLQYACIFPLPAPIDCTTRDVLTDSCSCYADDTDRPLCESSPGQTGASTTQHWYAAYPPPRLLEVLQGYGDNSVLGSICARNTDLPDRPDFAYRPSLDALTERLRPLLAAP
jgi:hypothetical protein